MEKAEYLDIKKQLSFDRPLWITLSVVAADICLIALSLYLLKLQGALPFIVSQLLLALVYFHNFALLHEAGHGNIHKSRWVNDVMGHYFSILAFQPYFPWKFIHQQHHLYTGNIDKDPSMDKIKKVREKNSVSWIYEFAWRSWIPLAGFVLQLTFITYPYRLWKSGKMTQQTFWLSVFSILWLIAAYVTLFIAFPSIVNIKNIFVSYVLYLVLNELINFPHHIQMPTFKDSPKLSKLHPWQQHITTRTCEYGIFSSLLALNFNYHTEHHFFPNLPWYRLKQLRKILKPRLKEEYTELTGISWNIKNRAIAAKDIVLPEVTHPLFQRP
jgi:fatty acid desaturase